MKRIVTHLSLLAAAAVFATGCVPVRHNLPPEQHLMEPGPGVGGPGPGVLGPPAMRGGPMMGGPGMGGPMMGGPGGAMPPGAIGQAGPDVMRSQPLAGMPGAMGQGSMMGGEVMPATFNSCGPNCNSCGGSGGCLGGGLGSNIPAGGGVLMSAGGGGGAPSTVQVTFGQPDGMQVRYDQSGGGMFDSEPLIVPARQNFPQGGLYRIKLTNISGREGVELYPTVELAYSSPRTGALPPWHTTRFRSNSPKRTSTKS